MQDVEETTTPSTSRRGYFVPIVVGLAILAAGLLPWTWLAQANLRIRPDLPWAAPVSVAYLAILLAWLAGRGPPRRNAGWRRYSTRRQSRAGPNADGLSAGMIVAAFVLVYAVWIALSLASPVPDLSAYPTTAYRWSAFLMGGITAGVVEEVAFRGYMQRGIERHDRANAVWITSLVFAASHITQGIEAVLLLGPGLFVASMLYGTLARRTGSLLPGIAIHVTGDLARVYVGVLRGDGSLLFVG